MSYSISISGHKDGLDTQEQRDEFFTKLENQTKDFAASLEGATYAAFNGKNVMPESDNKASE